MIETATDYKSLYEESVQLHEEYVKKFDQEIITLRHEIANLKRIIFGSKSESFIPQNTPSAQLSLDMQAEAVATCSVIKAQKIEYTRQQVEIKKNHPGAPHFLNIWNVGNLLLNRWKNQKIAKR